MRLLSSAAVVHLDEPIYYLVGAAAALWWIWKLGALSIRPSNDDRRLVEKLSWLDRLERAAAVERQVAAGAAYNIDHVLVI